MTFFLYGRPTAARIVFSSSRRGSFDLYSMPPEGGPEALLLASSSSKVPTDWSANGHVIFNQNGPEGGDMWAVRVEREPKPFPS